MPGFTATGTGISIPNIQNTVAQVTGVAPKLPRRDPELCPLLAMKGAVLSLAVGPWAPSGEVVREEEEERNVQEEAMYRTRILLGEEEEND